MVIYNVDRITILIIFTIDNSAIRSSIIQWNTTEDNISSRHCLDITYVNSFRGQAIHSTRPRRKHWLPFTVFHNWWRRSIMSLLILEAPRVGSADGGEVGKFMGTPLTNRFDRGIARLFSPWWSVRGKWARRHYSKPRFWLMANMTTL